MNYKPKIKYKLRAAIMAALSGLTLVATTLTASAAYGNNIGGSSSSYTNGSTPFSILGKSDAFAWRVNLYVSANPDGKLSKNDIIGSTQLPLVGSLLCTSSNNAANNGFTTYIQTNYTDTKRGGSEFSSSGVTPGTLSYTLPTLQQFEPKHSYYLDASGNTVAIADTGKISLFDGQYGGYGQSTSFLPIQNEMTNDDTFREHITDIFVTLSDKDKGKHNPQTPQDYGFLLRTLSSISPQIQQAIPEKAKLEGLNQTDAINTYLLPNSDKCMVEWAMVITPIYHITGSYPSQFQAENLGVIDLASSVVALDAYWFAQYDVTSTKLYDKSLLGAAGGNTNSLASGRGVLSRWLGCISGADNAGAPAAAAYCLKSKLSNDHTTLGVYITNISGGVPSQYSWAQFLVNAPANYAKKGGISVFTTKIEAPTPKIYYHLYTYELDEQNPPAGYTVGTTYAPKDLLQFTPNLGTPTVTSFSRDYAPTDSEYYYIPASDPKATENNNVPVAANDKLLTGKGTCQISLVSYQHFVDTNCFPKTVQFILVLPLILT